ncbi:hypothetical protein OF829_00520 [Sphingomonas sp. LB-2]|uniref:hypothetical protein n=1 Tax=Sphingomonas caeni TaxID=2984949 RepID=UPI00223268F8|nr:hypothetical protein [Sphingomonas caeni]MCW3845704.1 hypothetical protein [Sphingomonas caeni]
MQHQRGAAADSDVEAWHWLIDAIAAEIADGAPHDPKTLVARVAARIATETGGYGPYLPMMFADPRED